MKPKQLLKFFALLLCVVVVGGVASFSSLAVGEGVGTGGTVGSNGAAAAVILGQAIASTPTGTAGGTTASQISTNTLVVDTFGKAPGNASHGPPDPNRYNYLRIGLGILKNEPVEITTDPVEYSRNVQEYAKKYYVRAFGPCYYYNLGSATGMYSNVDGYGMNAVEATMDQCPV